MYAINKSVINIILILFPSLVFAQINTCTIKLSVEGQRQPVSVGLLHKGSSSTHDFGSGTSILIDSITAPGLATLIVNYKNWFPKRNRFDIYLVPGTIAIKVLTDKDSIGYLEVEGPLITKEYNDLLTVRVTNENIKIIKLKELLKQSGTDTLALIHQIDQEISNCFAVPRNYIRSHQSSPLSIIALQMMGSGDPTNSHPLKDLQQLFDSMKPEIKNSEKGKQYEQNLKALIDANLKSR
jgi:hypothetical protein